MRIFLNQVLLDYELEEATFQIVLTLGNGKEVVVSPSMHVEADMCEHELAADLTSLGGTLVRQERPRDGNGGDERTESLSRLEMRSCRANGATGAILI